MHRTFIGWLICLAMAIAYLILAVTVKAHVNFFLTLAGIWNVGAVVIMALRKD